MPDPVFLLELMAGAAVVAAAVALACTWPWRMASPTRVAIGLALGIGLTFVLGNGFLGRWPRWSLAEAEDRLLLIVLPAILGVEFVAAIRIIPRWFAWTLRIMVAAGAAPVLLFGSEYLADLAGPGTRKWDEHETIHWLGGMGLSIVFVWVLLGLLNRRAPSRSLPLALALVCASAAPTIMVSRYATGGPLLVPLAGALIGTAAASCLWTLSRGDFAAVGIGLIVLYALLVTGRFFCELTTFHAALILFAPLLMWLPEFLPGKKTLPWMRPMLRVAVVIAPVAVAFYLAQKPVSGVDGSRGTSHEPDIQDYQQFDR
jgi:hypothetical protein